MQNRSGPMGILLLGAVLASVGGCNSKNGWCVTEIGGKTSFGPEFRNFGDNTHDVRYTAIQSVEFKMANKWSLNLLYQRRDVDEGSGDNENAILVEVGYPLWNAPKKADKSAEELEIEGLERQLRMLDSELTAAGHGLSGSPSTAMVQSEKVE